MGFMDSYKRLERFCGDASRQRQGVSAYIDEMYSIRDGAQYVRGWYADLKQLKHYRWIRNKIAHEPDCTEANMCSPADTQWIDDFYDRILNRTDPLSLYRQAVNTRGAAASRSFSTQGSMSDHRKRQPRRWEDIRINPVYWILILAGCGLVAQALISLLLG